MRFFDYEDTIAAISTAMGESGIGIVRLSGEDAVSIADKIFKCHSGRLLNETETRKLVYGHIIDPENGEIIDEALVSVMKAPHTYTTQNVVELNCHGGGVATKAVFQAALFAGARPASPGEFTKRAFLGGRIDLTQAEAVMEVIGAKSEKGLKLSVNQLQGGLKDKMNEVDDLLIDLLSDMEANIDYPEYDIEELSESHTIEILNQTINRLEQILKTIKVNRIYQDGIATAIVGAPNVGKSSLLNQLLQKEKAIVTEIPGTTRDIIEDYLNVEGIPFKIVDTAGIRETEDVVEKIGVERSIQMIDQAELILFILDGSRQIFQDEIKMMNQLVDRSVIYIVNKNDLPLFTGFPEIKDAISVSIKMKRGLEKIQKAMVKYALNDSNHQDEGQITANLRQIALIEQALNHLKAALETIANGMPLEIVSIDIHDALSKIREITGKEVGDDVINEIFSKFCLGK